MEPQQPRDLVEYQSDHDLIIEIRTEMKGMRSDIQKLNDGQSKRQDTTDAQIKQNTDDINSLKTSRAIAYAYAGLITLVPIPIVAAYIQAGKL
jgi:hypothetical protein